jgi:hypothetical protein
VLLLLDRFYYYWHGSSRQVLHVASPGLHRGGMTVCRPKDILFSRTATLPTT